MLNPSNNNTLHLEIEVIQVPVQSELIKINFRINREFNNSKRATRDFLHDVTMWLEISLSAIAGKINSELNMKINKEKESNHMNPRSSMRFIGSTKTLIILLLEVTSWPDKIKNQCQ